MALHVELGFGRRGRVLTWVEVDAYVVKASEASAVHVLYPMIWYEELLLPTHKNDSAVSIADGQTGASHVALDAFERRKSIPMGHVCVLVGSPLLSEEPMSTANNLGVEICSEFWPIVCETTDSKVAAQEIR